MLFQNKAIQSINGRWLLTVNETEKKNIEEKIKGNKRKGFKEGKNNDCIKHNYISEEFDLSNLIMKTLHIYF